MQKTQSLKLIGMIAGLSLIAVMGINLLPVSENTQIESDAKNYIPRPPPSPMTSYGVDVAESSLKTDIKTSWIKSPSFVPENFVLNSVQNSEEGEFVTYTYNLSGYTERLDTFESNVDNGIVVLYRDATISYDQFVKDSEEQITYDPLRRYFIDIDNVQFYVEEGEDAYDRPTRVYMHDGTHSIVAISSQALPSDLAQMLRSTLN